MHDPRYVPMPDVTCSSPCTNQHTYSLNECALSCASIDGGIADKSWTVGCPRCKVPANTPCRRWDGSPASVACGKRWSAYDAQQNAQPTALARPDTTPQEPPATHEAPNPAECPAGVHSIFDPCPGDCHKLLEDPPQKPATLDDVMAVTFNDIANAYCTFANTLRAPSRHELSSEERERRDRYAATIRDEIKACTMPSLTPGQPPTLGATEYDLANAVLAERDDELEQLRAERDAALRLTNIWADAPDPLARAMAADLRTTIRSARPTTHDTPQATEPRLLPCGLCYEEDGQEVHPHPECRTVEQLRAERDQYAAALDAVRTFNKSVADGTCRAHAAEQARDTLHILDRSLNAPDRPPNDEEGQPQ